MASFLLSNPGPRTGREAGAYLLGELMMSGAMSANAEGDGATPAESLGRALALLQEVLEIVDSIDAPPEIGARVQEAMDFLEELQAQSDRS